MPYIKSFITASSQFRMQTDWRDRREQTTPVLNKILDDLKKKANWKQQCSFLLKCSQRNYESRTRKEMENQM